MDYLAALEYSDGVTKRQYQRDAVKIAEVQRGILAASQTAEPFDVFICYKETDESGQRTRDSLMAQDIYYQLTEQGRRVFFSRITLEDMVGVQYEPYIFAALHSAKVMIAVGTSAANFNAVWVKNEWSRFLALMKKDRDRLLLPCYKDMDPYDLPEALSVLQSYDMAKIGFIQDLVRGVNKVLNAGRREPEIVKETVAVQSGVSGTSGNAQALLQRGWLAIEDGEWDKADAFFEQVLNIDAESGMAYVGKLCAELRVREMEGLAKCEKLFDDRKNYQKAMRFGDAELKNKLEGFIRYINQTIHEKNERKRFADVYAKAARAMQFANTEQQFRTVATVFNSIYNFQDAEQKETLCLQKADQARFEEEKRVERMRVPYGKRVKGARIAAMEREQHNKKIATMFSAAVAFFELRNNVDARECSLALWTKIVPRNTVSAGYNHTVGLKANGTVVAIGDNSAGQCDVACWESIVAVSAGYTHTLGLKVDGTVVAAGDNDNAQCDVSDWTDIVAICAGHDNTLGLKADGTVMKSGNNDHDQCDVSGWKGIVAISAGGNHIVGLKADGTVVALGRNEHGQCQVSDWTDMIAIAAGGRYTVGLKADGTVMATGDNDDGQCDVSGWTDIVAISAGYDHTVGLKANGTVVTKGNLDYGQRKAHGWTEMVAISAGGIHTVGLKVDGTVVAVGWNNYDQCSVSDWRRIKIPAKREVYR